MTNRMEDKTMTKNFANFADFAEFYANETEGLSLIHISEPTRPY